MIAFEEFDDMCAEYLMCQKCGESWLSCQCDKFANHSQKSAATQTTDSEKQLSCFGTQTTDSDDTTDDDFLVLDFVMDESSDEEWETL